jgi:hypothetical protein
MRLRSAFALALEPYFRLYPDIIHNINHERTTTMNNIKLYISRRTAEILLKIAQDPSFLVEKNDWTQKDVEEFCWALTSRDSENKLTLTAKQFKWFCDEADWAIGEALG